MAALERRLRAWRDGDIDGLLTEGQTIQTQLKFTSAGRPNEVDDDATTGAFTELMFERKLHAALRYFTDNQTGECCR